MKKKLFAWKRRPCKFFRKPGVLTIFMGKSDLPAGKSNDWVLAIPFGWVQKIWAMIRGNAIFKVILLFLVYSADLSILYSVVADPGEGPGEPAPPPLIVRPNWGPGGRKFFFVETAPPPPRLRVWMTAPPLSEGLHRPLGSESSHRVIFLFMLNISTRKVRVNAKHPWTFIAFLSCDIFRTPQVTTGLPW